MRKLRKKRRKLDVGHICWGMKDEDVIKLACEMLEKRYENSYLKDILHNRLARILSRTVFSSNQPFD